MYTRMLWWDVDGFERRQVHVEGGALQTPSVPVARLVPGMRVSPARPGSMVNVMVVGTRPLETCGDQWRSGVRHVDRQLTFSEIIDLQRAGGHRRMAGIDREENGRRFRLRGSDSCRASKAGRYITPDCDSPHAFEPSEVMTNLLTMLSGRLIPRWMPRFVLSEMSNVAAAGVTAAAVNCGGVKGAVQSGAIRRKDAAADVLLRVETARHGETARWRCSAGR